MEEKTRRTGIWEAEAKAGQGEERKHCRLSDALRWRQADWQQAEGKVNGIWPPEEWVTGQRGGGQSRLPALDGAASASCYKEPLWRGLTCPALPSSALLCAVLSVLRCAALCCTHGDRWLRDGAQPVREEGEGWGGGEEGEVCGARAQQHPIRIRLSAGQRNAGMGERAVRRGRGGQV